ncbi:MAG: Na/Pi cotransporter family protein [bacterium]|nr:Na/Pi cotransporter family protein [bacterium]
MKLSDLQMIFQFVGGLGMFLYGMEAMADGLQRSAGSRMQKLLGILTENRLLGVLVGAAVTAIIQSSSATTVMVVGFVNAGIMNLMQATGIIMGANIGTTVTSWLVSMNEWGELLSPDFFAPLFIGIGALIRLFSKNHKKQEIGEIMLGFGVLFVGLSFMSSSISPYRDAPIFASAFQILGSNPVLGILTGAVVTAIIQSSSASVGILQTLALNGIVNWRSAIFITLGQNIGTCVTALISSAGAHKTAKRAAIIHLMFNVIGAMLFGVVMFVVFTAMPEFAASRINSVEISVFHTIFNVTNTLILFPFAGMLVKLSQKIIPEGAEEMKEELHLDARMMESPSFAMEAAENETMHMGELVLNTLDISIKTICESTEEGVQQVFDGEEKIDRANKALTAYLAKINNLSLSDTQHLLIKNLMYTISDFERIGDHCENLAELAQEKLKGNLTFGEEARRELDEICQAVRQSVLYALEARKHPNMQDIRLTAKYEQDVDALQEDLREQHIIRLSQGTCSTEAGIIFLDVLSNLERISDHAKNIAGYIKEEL